MRAYSHQLSQLLSPSPQLISSQLFGRDTTLSPQAGAAPGFLLHRWLRALCAAPCLQPPSHSWSSVSTGVQACLGKGTSFPRAGAGQCCCDSSWRFALDAPMLGGRARSPGEHGKAPFPEDPCMCPDRSAEALGGVDAMKAETGLSDTVHCIFRAGRSRLFPEVNLLGSFPSILGSLSSPADPVIYDVI